MLYIYKQIMNVFDTELSWVRIMDPNHWIDNLIKHYNAIFKEIDNC